MKLCIYQKTIENISIFDPIMDLYASNTENIEIVSENRRSYRKLDQLMEENNKNTTAIAISDLPSLGLNDEEILSRLDFFISCGMCLFLCKYPSSYEYGFAQPMNQAVLKTLQQSILNKNKHIVEIHQNKRKNSGRNKIVFPDTWDELYVLWEKHEISSKEFIEKSGLKKATFYNLLAEYKESIKEKNDYIKKYSCK